MRRPLSNVVDYHVRPGETLSGITRSRYGVASLWPKVARYNELKRPDLLFAGQRLRLPVPSALEALADGAVGYVANHRPARPVALPAIKFEMKDIMPVEAYLLTPSGMLKVTMSLKGDLTFQERGGVKEVSLSNLRKLQVKAESEARSGMQSLIAGPTVTFDTKECTLDLKVGLTSVLHGPDGSKLKHKLEVGFNWVKFVCEVQSAKGHWRNFEIEGNFGYEVLVDNYNAPLPKLVPAMLRQGVDSIYNAVDRFEREATYVLTLPAFWIVVLGVAAAVVLSRAPIIALAMIAFVVALEWLEKNGPGGT